MEAHFLTRELFRLFLAEDDDDLRGDLRWLIERRLPGTVVDAVACIEEGLEHLPNSGRPSLAVLDIRLPARPRMHPSADLRLAERLREFGVASLCITGHSGSEDVSE
ncbi:MAG: hypothetical protein ACKV2Q_00435 [Planctomycetaceae bacterium]